MPGPIEGGQVKISIHTYTHKHTHIHKFKAFYHKRKESCVVQNDLQEKQSKTGIKKKIVRQ